LEGRGNLAFTGFQTPKPPIFIPITLFLLPLLSLSLINYQVMKEYGDMEILLSSDLIYNKRHLTDEDQSLNSL